MANKRVKDLTTDTSLSAGDYVLLDSASEGTRKFDLGTEIGDLKSELGELSDLDTNDKSSLVAAVNEVAQGGGTGLSNDIKDALLQIASKVWYTDDDGDTYYTALQEALYPTRHATGITLNTNSMAFSALNTTQTLRATLTPSDTTDSVTWESSDTSVATVSVAGVVTSVGYGSATITATAGSVTASCAVVVASASLVSIEAEYTQSGTVYETDTLDSLKTDLVVTAYWDNDSTSTLNDSDYTLSGTLAVGTSTITVTYGGKTDNFSVTVTEAGLPTGYTAYDYVYNATKATNTNLDTGISASYCDVAYEHELIFKLTGSPRTTADSIYGCRNESGSDTTARILWMKNSLGGNNMRMDYAGTIGSYGNFDYVSGTKYKMVTKNGNWYMNDTLVQSNMDTGNYTPPASTRHIRLFYAQTGSGVSAYVRIDLKIYGFKITEISTGNVLYNFVPCTNENGVAGMYDKVNGVFKTAATAANLACGNDEV